MSGVPTDICVVCGGYFLPFGHASHPECHAPEVCQGEDDPDCECAARVSECNGEAP